MPIVIKKRLISWPKVKFIIKYPMCGSGDLKNSTINLNKEEKIKNKADIFPGVCEYSFLKKYWSIKKIIIPSRKASYNWEGCLLILSIKRNWNDKRCF